MHIHCQVIYEIKLEKYAFYILSWILWGPFLCGGPCATAHVDTIVDPAVGTIQV